MRDRGTQGVCGQGGRVDCKERGAAPKREQKEAKMSMEGKGGRCRSVLGATQGGQ